MPMFKRAVSVFITAVMLCSMFMVMPLKVSAVTPPLVLTVSPTFLKPAQINSDTSSDRTITVDVISGDRPWSNGQTLTVEVTRDGDTYSISIPAENVTQSGEAITVVLPETDLIANPEANKCGAYTVTVKLDGNVLGTGSLKIAEITGIEAKEDSNMINISGAGIACFQSSGLFAEVYDGASKLDTSTRVNCIDGQCIEFEFNKNLSLNKTYTLKLFDGIDDKSTYLPNDGNFTMTPILACSYNNGAPIISGNANETLVAADNNNLWAVNDSLFVLLCGPGIAYETNVTATEDDVSFTTCSTDEDPWQNGTYEARIMDNTHKMLGIAQFYVGTSGDVLQVEVRDSAGTLQPNCGFANLLKVETGGEISWKRQAFVLPDGKFYIYKSEIPVDQSNSGNYRAGIFAPDNLNEADAAKDFSITNGVISPNPVVLQFQTPNITGTVKMPDGITPAANVPISVLSGDNKTELFQACSKSDGTFNIKIAAGSYYLKAMPFSNTNAVASAFVPVNVVDGVNASVDIQLQPSQITVTAGDPSNTPLDTGKFWVKVEPIDNMNWDYDVTCRQSDYLVGNLAPGQYKIFAVPEGGCTFTQSFSQMVTVSDTGTATPATLNLQLTNPKITGTVTGMTSMDGHVVLYKKDFKGFTCVCDSQVNDDGSYGIGAVDNGDYFIRAELFDFSSLKSSFGSSLMTPVTISDILSTQNLTLGNTEPRLVYVNEVQKEEGRITAKVINVNSITRNPLENNSLKAEIVNEDGTSLTPKLEITGADNFMIHWEYFDQGNDEGDIDINVPGGINLLIGKYKLKFFDIKDPSNTEDDLLFASDLPDSSEFEITSSIYLNPSGFLPSKAGQKTVAQSSDQPQPWATGDILEIAFISDSGVSTPASGVTIQTDNSLDITLPSLTEGKYLMTIMKDSKLLAWQDIKVGTPQVNFIQFATDEDNEILLEGEYLEALANDSTMVKIYSGDTPVITTQKVWNFWGNLAVDFDNPLPAGDYTVKMWLGAEADENLIKLSNGGALKVVNQLKSGRPSVLSGYADGTTLTMSVKQGNTPWVDNQDLTLVLSNDKAGSDGTVIISVSDDTDVSAADLTFALPDSPKLMDGRWYVEVKSADILIAKGYFDVVNSSDIAFSGTVSGSGGPVAGAKVNVEREDKKEFYTFYTDADGSYKAYWISSPGTYNVWVEPKGTDPYMEFKAPDKLTIDETGHCTSPTQNFTLSDARLISGTISLPSGTAGNDMRFWVNGFCANGTLDEKNDDVLVYTEGKIATGSSSEKYTLKVPKDVTEGYCLQLFVDTNDYVPSYFYADGGTVYNRSAATQIDVSSGDQSGKDFTLVVGTTIEGNITIPDTVAIPQEGYRIDYFAVMDNGTPDDEDDDWGIFDDITLTSSTQAYTLHVPANPTGKPYKVAYDADPCGILELQGYYKASGTVYDGRANADPVDVSSKNATGIDLTARIRTDVETRAGFVDSLVTAVGADKFIQPSADEISSYGNAYADWATMTDEQKSAMAIAVKNGIVKGTDDNKINPSEFISRAAVVAVLDRTDDALGAKLVEIQPDKNFNDIYMHWAEDAILEMARASVVNGYEDGNFDPDGLFLKMQTPALLSNYMAKLQDANATRAGLIASAVYGLGKARFTPPTETDIAGYSAQYSDWNDIPLSMKDAVAIALKNNIISGNTEGMLQPDDKITRAEVSVVLCRILDESDPALALKDVRGLPSFTDVTDGYWAKSAIDRLYKANIINGTTASTFEPDKSFTYNSIQPVLTGLYSGISTANAVITVQPANQTVTYGAASATLSVTATGDNISYQWKKDGVAIEGATSSAYTVNNPVPADSGAYSVDIMTGIMPLVASVTSTTATLTVNPKELTVTGLTAENKTYDGTTAAVISGTATLSGKVGSDDVSLTGTPTSVFSDKNASNGKTVTVAGYTLSGADAMKYKLTQPTLSANIAKAALTATADNKQRAFGVSNPALTITYSGFVNGETKATSGIAEPAAACTATSLSPGGTYAITLSGGNGGSNYSLTLVNGILAVVPGLPNVTFSFDGADANKLKGATTAMEYSLDGGSVWSDCTNDMDLTAVVENISATNDIKVRVKAVTGPPAVPAGAVLTLDIFPAPAAPALTVNFATEKLTGATNLMEYKIGSGAYQTVTTTEAANGINLSSVIPSNGSPAKVLTIGIKGKGLTLKGLEQTINIPARPATPSVPTVAAKTPTSITLTDSTGLEYTKDDGTTWQGSASFTGLATGTAYSFKSRVKATDSAFASEKTAALPVTYYTVTFVANGGSPAPSVQTIIAGGTASAPGNMAKTGYTGGTSDQWYPLEDLSGSPYSFTDVVNANKTLYAKWTVDKFDVTAAVAGGTGGIISPAAKKVAYGDNLTVTILPNAGYELTGFTVGGADKLSAVANGKHLISNITADTEVVATFSKKNFSVVKNSGLGGSIEANATAQYGSSLTVNVTPDNGKNVSNVEYIMNGTTIKPALEANSFTIDTVTGPVTINAVFADVDKTALNAAVVNALLKNADAYKAEVSAPFKTALETAKTVLNDAAAILDQVTAATNALETAAAALTDDNKKLFTVTVTVPAAQAAQGTAKVSGATESAVQVKYGTDVTIAATPIGDNLLYKILVNGVQLNGNIIKNVTADMTVTVLFKSAIPAQVTAFKADYNDVLTLAINTVADVNSDRVNAAITAYSALGDNQKYLAVEYQLLKTLRIYLDNKAKAAAVKTAIGNLAGAPRVSEFIQSVNSVIAQYNSLTPDQQKLVGIDKVNELNKYKLEADVIFQKDLADAAKKSQVQGLIDGLLATIGDGGYADVLNATIAYNTAKSAYDTLTVDLKSQINTTKLTALKTVIDTANQAAAVTVQNQINALTVVVSTMAFDVAEGHKKAIIEAKNAYDALTEAQKVFVSSAAKAKLNECFESVAIKIEKPVEGLDTSVSFTGISDKVTDMDVAVPVDAGSKEATINEKLNSDGAETAMMAEMVLSITLKNGTDDVQPDGKVKMKIKITPEMKNKKPKMMFLDDLNGLYEVPSWITGNDTDGWYIEFETDHFSNYAVVSVLQNNNASLSALTLDGVTLDQEFNKDTLSYTASVDSSVRSTVVNPIVEDTGKANVTGAGTWRLSAGANTKNIVVTAEDGVTTKTYTVVVTRAPSTNSFLSSLSLSGITLSPDFDKNTLSYTASVENGVTSTTVAAAEEDTGVATVSGTGVKTLNTGANVINVVVTAENGSAKTYTITVTRAGVSGNTPQNPQSDSSVTTTPTTTSTTTQNPTPTQETATATKTGNTTVASITAKGALDAGTGKLTAEVEAKDMENLTALAGEAEKAGQKAVVEIKLETSPEAKAVSVEIPKESFNRIANETTADVKVDAGLGTVTFNSKAVKYISAGANTGDMMSIGISKVEDSALTPEIKAKVGDRPVYDFFIKSGNTEITGFGGGSADIGIPYTPKAGENKNAIIVYYIGNDGKLKTVRGKYDPATGNVSFKTNHFSRFAVGYNEVNFDDVKTSDWYSDAVSFIAARGITAGTGNGVYSPQKNLTRGEYIVMMMRTYGIEPVENAEDNFADSGNTYYTNYLAAAKKLGIANGIGNNMFAPDKEITRQEMFTLLYNTLKAIGELPEASNTKAVSDFSDYDSVAAWARDAMELFVETGIINGTDGKLLPADTSNRAQMAQVLYNLLQK